MNSSNAHNAPSIDTQMAALELQMAALREAKRLEAVEASKTAALRKKAAEEERQRTYKESAEHYIKCRMNELMYKAADEFDLHDGGCEMTFIRKPHWNIEEFDRILGNECDDLESRLNDHDAAAFTRFDVSLTHLHDEYDRDGNVVSFWVEISWETNPPNPFEDEYDSKMEKTLTDGTLMYDDKGRRCYWDDVEGGWVASSRHASARFIALLDSPDFKGFEGWDDDDEESADE
jgi:hypothetical protein